MFQPRLENRIQAVIAEAIVTEHPDELDAMMQELREFLHEHSERFRKLAADKLAPPVHK